MKTAIFLSIAALCATLATAIPSPEPVVGDNADLDAAAKFDDFIGYYCSIPGKCDEPATVTARSAEPGWWYWNICRLPGQPCTEKVKRSAEPEPSWWYWNICRLPGQPCTEKNKRSLENAVTGFPGSEALEDGATEEQRALADEYKLAAEILFG